MAINQLENTLEAITRTISTLEKSNCDEKKLKELREERNKILKELNLA